MLQEDPKAGEESAWRKGVEVKGLCAELLQPPVAWKRCGGWELSQYSEAACLSRNQVL